MVILDWLVLLGTLAFIVLYGVWKNRKNKTIEDYLKGGNNSRWWTIGLSVMATQASAITFLSTPGQAFHDGMGFVQFYFGLPLAVVIICLFFIPIYHRLKVYTAYEFLEERFDLRTRTLTAILFLVQRGLAGGITIYAPAIILSVVLGWNLKILILLIGCVVISYTLIGGTRAVNVTQKQQMFIIFLGMITAFIFIINSFPVEVGFIKALTIAGATGKLEVIDFSFDPNSRYTFWSGITGGLFLALSYFGTDQSQVQRYLSGKSLKESQLGLIMNGFLKVPMQFFILLVGVMVFVFYQFEPSPINFNPKAIEAVEQSNYKEEFNHLEATLSQIQELKRMHLLDENNVDLKEVARLDIREKEIRKEAKSLINKAAPNIETNDKDYVFISFILKYLPQGLIGLLLAVILSAAMSSTASELNALAATTVVDLYKRNRNNLSETHYVNASKFFTLFWGIIAILFASFGSLYENLIQLVNIIGSIFYGTILGVFVVAIFLKRIKGQAIFYAALISEALIIYIFYLDILGYLWLNVIGTILTILLGYLLQFTLPKKS
ncbi:sodium:solute symporter [Flavobacteriaceae bacterium]|uniref:sodium:solute symporter n=1 Tax=Candidatus Arcticimaribacter forsetii TaxID=2820661 RepID=UPI0020779BAF|nr:sodium:solute symporter [Candidatus Arcticimaribacter forsetii]MDA8699278.1 sodium:solute symporter [Flavobacteriaceae bacterium]MDB4674948.1 sodium:solute symporter [Flavobacteriaceae bacterium]MDB4717092.1 sodium:solute symporter [Flavobacteriaceae bacterium]MDB4751426.1 sodium:solute symporter [Flavobacteriaceae bacterium]